MNSFLHSKYTERDNSNIKVSYDYYGCEINEKSDRNRFLNSEDILYSESKITKPNEEDNFY